MAWEIILFLFGVLAIGALVWVAVSFSERCKQLEDDLDTLHSSFATLSDVAKWRLQRIDTLEKQLRAQGLAPAPVKDKTKSN